jgi:hypothetical protein
MVTGLVGGAGFAAHAPVASSRPAPVVTPPEPASIPLVAATELPPMTGLAPPGHGRGLAPVLPWEHDVPRWWMAEASFSRTPPDLAKTRFARLDGAACRVPAHPAVLRASINEVVVHPITSKQVRLNGGDTSASILPDRRTAGRHGRGRDHVQPHALASAPRAATKDRSAMRLACVGVRDARRG